MQNNTEICAIFTKKKTTPGDPKSYLKSDSPSDPIDLDFALHRDPLVFRQLFPSMIIPHAPLELNNAA